MILLLGPEPPSLPGNGGSLCESSPEPCIDSPESSNKCLQTDLLTQHHVVEAVVPSRWLHHSHGQQWGRSCSQVSPSQKQCLPWCPNFSLYHQASPKTCVLHCFHQLVFFITIFCPQLRTSYLSTLCPSSGNPAQCLHPQVTQESTPEQVTPITPCLLLLCFLITT